jgi:hypothetical protein
LQPHSQPLQTALPQNKSGLQSPPCSSTASSWFTHYHQPCLKIASLLHHLSVVHPSQRSHSDRITACWKPCRAPTSYTKVRAPHHGYQPLGDQSPDSSIPVPIVPLPMGLASGPNTLSLEPLHKLISLPRAFGLHISTWWAPSSHSNLSSMSHFQTTWLKVVPHLHNFD